MKTELLNPQNSAVIFIDFQPQMVFGVANIDRQTLFNNVLLLAKAAKIFKVPTILTTVESKSFSGNMWPQLLDIFPDQKPIERSSMNFLGRQKIRHYREGNQEEKTGHGGPLDRGLLDIPCLGSDESRF
jgi:nicotinamidase-related amidase